MVAVVRGGAWRAAVGDGDCLRWVSRSGHARENTLRIPYFVWHMPITSIVSFGKNGGGCGGIKLLSIHVHVTEISYTWKLENMSVSLADSWKRRPRRFGHGLRPIRSHESILHGPETRRTRSSTRNGVIWLCWFVARPARGGTIAFVHHSSASFHGMERIAAARAHSSVRSRFSKALNHVSAFWSPPQENSGLRTSTNMRSRLPPRRDSEKKCLDTRRDERLAQIVDVTPGLGSCVPWATTAFVSPG